MSTKKCIVCNNKIEQKPCESAAYFATKKYCSSACYWSAKKGVFSPWLNVGGGHHLGHLHTEEAKKKMARSTQPCPIE